MKHENIMFCPRCGGDNPGKAKFCNECGFDLHEVRSILLKQAGSDETHVSENGGAPTPVTRPAVPVKKEDPKKPYIRTTSLLPDCSGETLQQYPVPVQASPKSEKAVEPVSAQPDLPEHTQQVPESPFVSKPERIRNPSLAAALSLIPGLGQVYNGMLIRGIVLFIATFLGLLIFIIPGICVWIYCIYDAYRTSGKINRGEIPLGPSQKKTKYFLFALNPLVIIFLVLIISVFLSGNASPSDVNIPEPYFQPLNLGPERMQSFRYTLRGFDGTISIPLYAGANDYFASAGEANLSQEDQHLDIINDYRQSIYLKDLVARIRSSATTPDDQARIAVSLVQHIPYDTAKARKNDEGKWFNSYYPYEVLYNNKGKCDEKAHLLAFLLKELGYGTVIFEFPGERHSAVGIKSPTAYAFRNTGHAFVESTAPTIITDTNGQVGSLKIRDFTDPVVVKIADGNTMTGLVEEYEDAKKLSETPGKIRYTSSVSSALSSSILSYYSNPYSTIRQQTYQPTYYTLDNPDYVALAEKYGIDYQTTSGSGTSTTTDIAGNQAKYTSLVQVRGQLARKDYASALVTINEALTKKPDDTGLLMTKSGIQAIMGKYQESLTTLAAVLSSDPANPSAYYTKALVYQEMKDYTASLDAYNAAIQFYPQYTDAMTSRGTLLAKQKKYDEALRSYDQALAINPDYAEAWVGKGDLFSIQGKKSEAMTAYKNALSAAPGLSKVWTALGALYAEEGRCGESVTCYARAAALDNSTRTFTCLSPLFYSLFGFGCLTGIISWGYLLNRFTKKK